MTDSSQSDAPPVRVVPPQLGGARLDAAVRGLWTVTWGKARAWIAGGKVSLGGQLCQDPGREVVAGDELAMRLDARRPRRDDEIGPEAIVHLDEHVIVVRKPSGVSTIPYDEPDRAALDEQLRRLLARRGGPRRGARPALYIVHRLDRGTSGLLVFARTMVARDRLSQQFREHTVHRRYLAVAHGDVRSGTLRSHLVVDRGDGRRGSSEQAPDRVLRRTGGGKLAITHVTAMERLHGATLVECRLETGRTNQIRIHLSESGHPLLGETIYLRDYTGQVLPAPRLMLHAAELGFVHPATGASLRFSEPLPVEMEQTIGGLRRPK